MVTTETNNGNNNGNGKSQGFFSRFIRRNSKDRKSIISKSEKLTSSEPSIKEGMAILMESSSSEESSRSQSQEVLVLDPKDRNRSSSPASTIQRPRSGKEYRKSRGVEPLTQQNGDSLTTSPLTTAQSPEGASVFTFDTAFIGSTMGGGELLRLEWGNSHKQS